MRQRKNGRLRSAHSAPAETLESRCLLTSFDPLIHDGPVPRFSALNEQSTQLEANAFYFGYASYDSTLHVIDADTDSRQQIRIQFEYSELPYSTISVSRDGASVLLLARHSSPTGRGYLVKGRIYSSDTAVIDAETTPSTTFEIPDTYINTVLPLDTGFVVSGYHATTYEHNVFHIDAESGPAAEPLGETITAVTAPAVEGADPIVGILSAADGRFLLKADGATEAIPAHHPLNQASATLLAYSADYHWVRTRPSGTASRFQVVHAVTSEIADSQDIPGLSYSNAVPAIIRHDTLYLFESLEAPADLHSKLAVLSTPLTEPIPAFNTRLVQRLNPEFAVHSADVAGDWLLIRSVDEQKPYELARLSTGEGVELLDTNPLGADVYHSDTMLADAGGTWMLANNNDQGRSLYRLTADGLTEYDEILTADPSGGSLTSGYLLKTGSGLTLLVENGALAAGSFEAMTAGLYTVLPEQDQREQGPTNVQWQPVDDGRMRISWDPLDGVDFYQILTIPVAGDDQAVVQNETAVSVTDHGFLSRYHTNSLGPQFVRVRGVRLDGTATDWTTTPWFHTPRQTLENAEIRYENDVSYQSSYHNHILLGTTGTHDTRRDFPQYSLALYNAAEDNHLSSPLSYASAYSGTESDWLYGQDYLVTRNYFRQSELTGADFTFSLGYHYQPPVSGPFPLQEASAEVVSLPLNLLNGEVLEQPVGVSVSEASTELRWQGSLTDSRQKFYVWVEDISRQRPRVLGLRTQQESAALNLPSGDYRAWVGLEKNDGSPTMWSDALEFSVLTAPQELETSNPPDDKRPVFRWVGHPATKSEVYVSSLSTGRMVIRETVSDQNHWYPVGDLEFGRYAVWVREYSSPADTWSDWSHVAVTQITPSEISPAVDETSRFDRRPVIRWDAQEGVTEHQIWIGDASGRLAYRAYVGRTGAHYSTTSLPAGDYTAWVQANSRTDSPGPWGEGVAFTVKRGPEATQTGRALSWENVSGATHFEIWVDYLGGEAESQSRILHTKLLPNTDRSLTLADSLPAGNYKVWIRAVRAESGGVRHYTEWSGGVEFTLTATEQTPLEGVALDDLYADQDWVDALPQQAEERPAAAVRAPETVRSGRTSGTVRHTDPATHAVFAAHQPSPLFPLTAVATTTQDARLPEEFGAVEPDDVRR